MQRICQISGEEFEVCNQEVELLGKMGLQLPLYSPKMREIMRMVYRNDRNLFMRKCDYSGENILSVYRKDAPFPVYKYDYWIKDDWDLPYLEYDLGRSFFEQFAELQRMTPRVALFSPYNENCDYANAAEKNRNCYMHILSDRDEDCYYTHAVFSSKDCIDSAYLNDCELCYECTDCKNCYECRMCFLSDNSSECNFCFDLKGCRNCFMSKGLRNQEYFFRDEKLTKEDYEKKLATINFGSYEAFENYKKEFLENIVLKGSYKRMVNTENCDGNFLINSKNCHHCFDLTDAEDCFYTRLGANHIKDVHHSYAIVDFSELIVGNISTTESYNCHNVIGCWTCRDSSYCHFIQGCSNCIGCISLRRGKNCILNKEYSPEEFAVIKKKIMEELGSYWGNPFPLNLAVFSYMDSTYRDYHGLEKEEVEKIGWYYGEKEKVSFEATNLVENMPDNIKDFSENDRQKIYKCHKSGQPFKIITQEMQLLKKLFVPTPRLHHEERFLERVKWRKIIS